MAPQPATAEPTGRSSKQRPSRCSSTESQNAPQQHQQQPQELFSVAESLQKMEMEKLRRRRSSMCDSSQSRRSRRNGTSEVSRRSGSSLSCENPIEAAVSPGDTKIRSKPRRSESIQPGEKPKHPSGRSRQSSCGHLPLLKKLMGGSVRSMAAGEVESNEPPITSPNSTNSNSSISSIQQKIASSEMRPRLSSRLIGNTTAAAIAAALTFGNPMDLLRASSQRKIVTKSESSRDVKANGNPRDLRPVSSKLKMAPKAASGRDVTASGNPRDLRRVSSQGMIATKSASSRDVTASSTTTDLLPVFAKGKMAARAESSRNVTATSASKESKGPPSTRISMNSISVRRASSSRTSRSPTERVKSSHKQKEQRKANNENVGNDNHPQNLCISNHSIKVRGREMAADRLTNYTTPPTLAKATLVSPTPSPFVPPFKMIPGQRHLQLTAALNKVVEAYDKQNLTTSTNKSSVSVMDICNQVFEATANAMQQRQDDGSERQQQQRDEGEPLLSSSLVSSSVPDFQKRNTYNGIYVAASDPDTTIATVENCKNQDMVSRQHLLPTDTSVSANNFTPAEQNYTIAEFISPASKSSSKPPPQGSPAFVRPPNYTSLDVTGSVGVLQHRGGRNRGEQRTKSATTRSKSLPPPHENEEASLAVAAHGAARMEAESARDGEHALEVEEPTEAEQGDSSNNESLQEHQPKPTPDQATEKDAGDQLIQAATAMADVLNMLLTITKTSDPSDSVTNTTATGTDDGQESEDGNSTIGEASLISKSVPRRLRSKSLTTLTKPRTSPFSGYKRCVAMSAAQQTAPHEGAISHVVAKQTGISSDQPPASTMRRGRHRTIRDGEELRELDAGVPQPRKAMPRRTRSKSLDENCNDQQHRPVVARNILVESMEGGRSRWDA